MKNLFSLFLIFLTGFNSYSQSKKDLLIQIESLKQDTSYLAQENRRLKEQLNEIEWKFNDQKKSAEFWKSYKERSEYELNRKHEIEINQLIFLLERYLVDSTQTQFGYKVVYFGKKDEFHGYRSTGSGGGDAPSNYIAIPFGVNRTLTNTIDLSNFSLSSTIKVFYKVEIASNGNVIRLWCNEKKSQIKNRDLLRMIGEEIKRQAKYSRIERKEEDTIFTGIGGELVELSLTIPSNRLKK